MNNGSKWQPFIYGVLIGAGVLVGVWLKPATGNKTFLFGSKNKFTEMLQIINQAYVDTVDTEKLEETALNEMLSTLDPHSVYIPASDLSLANEQLDGNFEGIGIEFSIINDTIMVVTALSGGPSKELGIQPGDRIVKVDSINVAGIGITNEQVFKKLRGKKGSQVQVEIVRPGQAKAIIYRIKRNTIPIYSVDAHMMLNTETGYIRISRFAANTHEEFLDAFADLQKEGLKNLVLDLRGNPGGYLAAATQLADELLDDKKLIVYTVGRTQPMEEYRAENPGCFESGKLIVLIDEGSASASEILSGAIQDWDRGVVIGRRSFGKGLVQQPYELSDGSALRLTVSRYYTPSGRSIQKDYKHEGYDEYEHEVQSRYEAGELEDAGKFSLKDTTIYKTSKGRVVYGGGGIMPDVFVPIDTSYNTRYLTQVLTNSIITRFAYSYADANRKMMKQYPNVTVFNAQFHISDEAWKEFRAFAAQNGVSGNNEAEMKRSEVYIREHIKALIARQMWRDEGYFTVLNSNDKVIRKALEVIGNYDKTLSAQTKR